MSQRAIKQKVCDRCLKDTLATTTTRYSIGEVEYEIDLCEKHADMFQRDMSGWTRCSRESEKATFFGRPKVALENHRNSRVEAPTARRRRESVEHPPIERPEVRKLWFLTQHAEERLEERGPIFGFERKDIFLAAQAPEQVQPSANDEDALVYVRGPVAIVVNRQNSEILTVMPAEWGNSKMGAVSGNRS